MSAFWCLELLRRLLNFLEKFVHPWVKCFKKKLFSAETTFLDYQVFSKDIILYSVSLQKIFMQKYFVLIKILGIYSAALQF